MIRILHCVNDMHRAGLETMLMNYYRHIDRSKIQFDFLSHRPYESDYDREIMSLGGRVYHAPRLYPQNYIRYFQYMKQFYKDHPEYKIVHSHIDSMSYLPLSAAMKAGIPVRIAHSHNTSMDRDFKYLLKQYFRTRITRVANCYCACGQDAGVYLFGDNTAFTIIPNAIETNQFLFNETVRKKVRKKLRLDHSFVVGHVGRLSYQKNHRFLIEVFKNVYDRDANAKLMLVGSGEKEEEIRNQVHTFHLDDAVVFLGNRSDVNELYQAMDVFVMPSFFEGIPVTGIEAQFAGLTCLFSDKVPVEVDFSEHCKFLPLESGSAVWASEVLKHREEKKRTGSISDGRYDITYAYRMLESYYMKLAERIYE